MAGIVLSDFQIPIDWLRREEISLEDIQSIVPDGKSLHPDTLLKILSKSALPLGEETFRWKIFRFQLDDDGDVNDPHVTEEGVQALRDMVDAGLLSNLETLVWEFPLNFNSTAIKALLACFQAIDFTNLRHLSLRRNYVAYDGAVAIAEIVKSGKISTLRHLDLTYNDFDDNGVVVIASALESGKLRDLQHLSLRGNNFGPIGMRSVSAALQTGNIGALEYLDLSQNDIGDEGAQLVSEALSSGKLAALKHLDLSMQLINDGGRSIGEGLQAGKVPALQHLNISENRLEEGPAKAIMEALRGGKVPALQELLLTENFLCNEGAMAVIEALRSLTGIQRLELGYNWIDREPAMALAAELQSGQLPALQYLYFVGNNIGEEGEAALEAASQAGKIATLDLHETEEMIRGPGLLECLIARIPPRNGAEMLANSSAEEIQERTEALTLSGEQ